MAKTGWTWQRPGLGLTPQAGVRTEGEVFFCNYRLDLSLGGMTSGGPALQPVLVPLSNLPPSCLPLPFLLTKFSRHILPPGSIFATQHDLTKI